MRHKFFCHIQPLSWGRSSWKGVTLIELVIALAIVGVLTTLAVFEYSSRIQESRRADAQAALRELAAFMEQRYAVTGRFNLANGNPPALPLQQLPREGGNAYYQLDAVRVTRTAYILRARPVGAQRDDTCNVLTLDHRGQTLPNAPGCW